MPGAAAWPDFDLAVAPGGYAWWYIDALSDDGRFGLVLIAFIGSVFSPYYAAARRRRGDAAVPAEQHVAINVALYQSDRRSHWTMTERGAGQLQREATQLQLGASSLVWAGDHLRVQLDERGLPWPLPSRVLGEIRLHPMAMGAAAPRALSPDGVHQWWPVAPLARVSVNLPEPGWQWQGQAYMDSNRGSAPLAQGFRRWHWARAALGRRHAAVVYDAECRDGQAVSWALHFDARGHCEAFDAPPQQALPSSAWRLARATRSAASDPPSVQRTLQDAPFYARSLVRACWLGQPVLAMHESLDMDRFQSPWVQAMLPFRMPRRAG